MALESMEMVRDFLSVRFSPNLLLLGFDDGSPDGHDPLQLARQMAARGITLVRLFLSEKLLYFSSSSPVLRCLRTCIERIFGADPDIYLICAPLILVLVCY